MTTTNRRALIWLLFLIAVIAVAYMMRQNEKQKIPIGGRGILIGSADKLSPIAADEKSLHEFLNARHVNDQDGVTLLLFHGRIFTVESGTRVLVLDYGDSLYFRKIRILNGPKRGRAGYIMDDWIRPEFVK